MIACDINVKTLTELAEIDGRHCAEAGCDRCGCGGSCGRTSGYTGRAVQLRWFRGAGSILECDDDQWDFSFDLNVKAMYRLAKLVLPGMLENGRWVDHQHVLGGLFYERCAKPLFVLCFEGRGDWPDQSHRRRLRCAGHPL